MNVKWVTILAVVVLAAVGVALLSVSLHQRLETAGIRTQTRPIKGENKTVKVVVVGAGLTAAGLCRPSAPALVSVTQIHEGTGRVGGLTMSAPSPVTPISTETYPREFGAWTFNAVTDAETVGLLRETGVRPVALAGLVTRSVPSGFGWQSVILAAMGAQTPVQYHRVLQQVEIAPDRASARLTFASGHVSSVDLTTTAVVLTIPALQLLAVTGVPAAFATSLRAAFSSTTVGVLYATWPSTQVSWRVEGGVSAEGATLTTSTPLGTVVFESENNIRCEVTGEAAARQWTQWIVDGEAVVAGHVAAYLSTTLDVKVPPPSNIAFQSWPNAVYTWVPGTDVPATFGRPWGSSVPIWWANAETAPAPKDRGRIEGALTSAATTAQAIARYFQT